MSVSAVRPARDHPIAVTVVLSVIGYSLVIGTFLGVVPRALFPDLSLWAVNRIADAIAVINTVTVGALAFGWYSIRQDRVRRHRISMMTAFGLIMLFLVLYLLKIGGGGTKEFVGPTLPYYFYLAMLAIHIILSIVSVPVVVYQVVTGISYSTAELRRSNHARVGRIAATAWIVSLTLGVFAYLLLNHVYGWRFIEAGAALILVGVPAES
ncbi:MAG: DUF420 domain-containing protein [Halobacteriales archaeon]|nr:DUF420 domain-containing protein [Halobacteriales archaeon]